MLKLNRPYLIALALVALAIGFFLSGHADADTLVTGISTAMFIGPCYALVNNGVSISTAITAIQVGTGTGGPIECLRASVTQGSTATSAQLAVSFLRKTAGATVTIAVAGTTLVKQNPVNPTSGVTISTSTTGITATVEGTNGEQFVTDGLNDLNGYIYLPAQEERPLVPISSWIALTFMTAPQSATRYARIAWRELRGS
jgi:hypothetical protein